MEMRLSQLVSETAKLCVQKNDTRMLVRLMHNPQLENYTVGGA